MKKKIFDLINNKEFIIGCIIETVSVFVIIFSLYQLWKISNKMWWYGFIIAIATTACTIGNMIVYDYFSKNDKEN